MKTDRLVFEGHILGASFSSGDRFVAGRWHASPFGPFADVMWCRPDGTRILLAPRDTVARFVAHHYSFTEVAVTDVRVERRGDGIEMAAGPIAVRLVPRPPGLPSRVLRLRPRKLRTVPAWIAFEDAVLRPVVGPLFGPNSGALRTRGVTRDGSTEWYAIHDFRDADATASVDGRDLGPVTPGPPAGFGFSEFPGGAAIVRVTSIFRPSEPR
ncbi:MAG: hypothetical protein ABI572_10510 [Actinomycetota bacterium]